MRTFDQINAQLDAGIISESEARAALDAIGIRGAWRKNGAFVGYNYRAQSWIDAPAITAATL